AERGQEPARGAASGREVWIPGLRLPGRPLFAGRLEGSGEAEAEPADGVAGQTPGSVPTAALTPGGSADRGDHPDSSGVGELLPDRERASVRGVCEAVGRAEGAATFDAGEGPPRLRLEEEECGGAPGAARALGRVPSSVWGRARTRSPPIGHITHDAKQTGERRTGNPFAPFDEAGAGNGLLRAPRQSSTLPMTTRRRFLGALPSG